MVPLVEIRIHLHTSIVTASWTNVNCTFLFVFKGSSTYQVTFFTIVGSSLAWNPSAYCCFSLLCAALRHSAYHPLFRLSHWFPASPIPQTGPVCRPMRWTRTIDVFGYLQSPSPIVHVSSKPLNKLLSTSIPSPAVDRLFVVIWRPKQVQVIF
jgi:hypothetical protein